jgi:hypothetical protein
MISNLKKSVHISHEKYLNGDWTKNNVLSYLQANGLNARSREIAFQHADNCRNIMKYQMDDENNLDMIFLRKDADENPEMYQRMPFPPIWDDLFDDSKQVVAPMHTLGPCVIKNTQQLLFQFLKLRNKQAPMLENMNVQFDIISDMKLDWCKVFPVDTSKFGSWVSENWISFGRIMKWIYSTIESVAPDFTFIFSTSPVKTWSNKNNEGWLRY